jgi:hypothetical protein
MELAKGWGEEEICCLSQSVLCQTVTKYCSKPSKRFNEKTSRESVTRMKSHCEQLELLCLYKSLSSTATKMPIAVLCIIRHFQIVQMKHCIRK